MDPTAELDGSVASMSLSEAGSIDAGGSTAGSSRSSTELRREQVAIGVVKHARASSELKID
jgi:hypothetical protein